MKPNDLPISRLLNRAKTSTSRGLWHRLTALRLVLGLLGLEGFLFLSERFEWFDFSRHKGWAPLIATAAVTVAILIMLLRWGASLVYRLRFQFSIRSLLMLTVVVAIACSWLAVEKEHARKQQEAVEVIRKVGGMVSYDNAGCAPTPGWASCWETISS